MALCDYLLDESEAGGGNLAEHADLRRVRQRRAREKARDYTCGCRPSFGVRGSEFDGAA